MSRLLKVRVGRRPDNAGIPDDIVIAHGTELTQAMTGLDIDEGTLTASGAMTSSSDDEIIEGYAIYVDGDENVMALDITHNNVTVRNMKIEHDGPSCGIRVRPGVTGTLIENCYVDGMSPLYGEDRATGNFGNPAIWLESPSTVRWCHLTGMRSGVRQRTWGNTIVENWIDEPWRNAPGVSGSAVGFRGTGEADPAQTTVARNRVIDGPSAAFTMYAFFGPIRNVLMADNLIIGQENGFGLYGGFLKLVDTDPDHHHHNENVRIEGNRFDGTFQFPTVVGEGTNAAVQTEQPGNTFTNNRWVGGTEDLPARCGVQQDACESDWTTSV